MTTGELVAMFRAIEALRRADPPAPATFGFAINLNRRALHDIVATRDESYLALVEKYALRDADGNKVAGDGPGTIKVDPQYGAQYVADLKALDGTEPPIVLQTVHVADCPPMPLSIMAALAPMIAPPSPPAAVTN